VGPMALGLFHALISRPACGWGLPGHPVAFTSSPHLPEAVHTRGALGTGPDQMYDPIAFLPAFGGERE